MARSTRRGPASYDPKSLDAILATMLARMDADALGRDDFRRQILKRLEDGTARMDAQDKVLDEIRAQTLKTNGRVTSLESRWKAVAAKIAAGATVLYGVGQMFLWLLEKGYIRIGR